MPCFGQPETPIAAEGELQIDILPRFVSKFRERAWVPVDVIVTNNKQDISGVLEVTLLELDEPRSPIYRVPVESPKGSRKRFRAYCNFGAASSMNVMLYSGRRRALPDPLKLNLSPIDGNDVLALVLDDEPADYGFLYNAVQRVSPGLGFHREGMGTSELRQLPEYPQCYDPYTMIILGRINPNEVPPRQQELVRRYIEHGGVVVLCVGENAARLRGTWVEELAGVRIGDVVPGNELAFARSVFNGERMQGAREGKSIVYSAITPSDECYVQDLGGDAGTAVLATARSIGSGHVVTIAVDAAGKALHETNGFIELWSSLIDLREEASEPHYDAASWQAANTLPTAAGIRVYPRSSVMIYLGLYFAIGIVGNWIFWSLLRRREMAWVTLVFVSFAFTAYALVYGTAGRAKATEISQIEVLRVPLESPTAKLRSTVGIVAARSSRYTLTFTHAYPLVQDIEARSMIMGTPQRSSIMGRVNAFQFVQGPDSIVNNFSVGASEMRIVQVESEIASPGTIDGALVWDANGIHGDLVNNTGLTVRNPFLLVNGTRSPLRVDGNRWNAAFSNEEIGSRDALLSAADRNLLMSYGYYGGNLLDTNRLREAYMEDLFASERNSAFPDERVGPYVCGWIDQKPYRSLDIGEPANERIYATLLVADVTIATGEGAAPRRVELEADVPFAQRKGQFDPSFNYGGDSLRYSISGGEPIAIQIEIPRQCLAHADSVLEVDVYSGMVGGEQADVVYYPKGTDESWAAEHRGETVNAGKDGQNVRVTTYTIDDWASRMNPQTLQIDGEVAIPGIDPKSQYARVDVRARLLVPQTEAYGGVWKKWQS